MNAVIENYYMRFGEHINAIQPPVQRTFANEGERRGVSKLKTYHFPLTGAVGKNENPPKGIFAFALLITLYADFRVAYDYISTLRMYIAETTWSSSASKYARTKSSSSRSPAFVKSLRSAS